MSRHVSASHLAGLLPRESSGGPGYRDLADQIRMLVLDGRVAPGTRLPSERELTAVLTVSRTTVTRAYAHLREQGFVDSRRGSGSTVTLPRGTAEHRLAPAEGSAGTIGWTIAAGQASPGVGRAFARACELVPDHLGGTGYSVAGLLDLRTAIAERYAERGLSTDPEQIVVTSGAQSALGLVLAALADPGDRAIAETPTYPNAIESLRRHGLRPVGVPIHPSGWDVDSFASALRQTAARWAYLIPDFHNPTGALMDDETRRRLGVVLRRSGTVAIVDEAIAELGLEVAERDMPLPFASHATSTITIGSASKTFWGGLRVGWVRAPHDLVPRLTQARSGIDLGTPVLEQLVVRELLRDGATIMAEQRRLLRARRDRLRELLAAALPAWRPNDPPGGLSLWITLPERTSSRLAVAAEEVDLVLTAGPRFFVDGGGERFLRLPYSRERDDLDEAVARLARAATLVPARSGLSSTAPAMTA